MTQFYEKTIRIQAFKLAAMVLNDMTQVPRWVIEAYKDGILTQITDTTITYTTRHGVCELNLKEDWLILGPSGEVYPCSNTAFVTTYRPVQQ